MDSLTSEDIYLDYSCSLGAQKRRLSDTARIEAFKEAILNNKHLFENKVVLDVGSGLGILSLLAAKAGAATVFSLEVAGLAEQAEQVARLNRNTSRIQVVRGRVGQVSLPVPGVDVILSDWMGPGLAQDSLLGAVLEARDRWLLPGGLVFPDRATLWLAGTRDRLVERSLWWRDVYGFNMGTIEKASLGEAVQEKVNERDVVTSSCLVGEFLLQTCSRGEVARCQPWALTALKDDYIGGLVLFWQVHFSHGQAAPITLSTAPLSCLNSRQLVLGLEFPLTVCRGEELLGVLQLRPDWREYRTKVGLQLQTFFRGAKCQQEEEREYSIS